MAKTKKSYTIAKKREALDLVAVSSELEAATRLGISRHTIRDWVVQKYKIRGFTGSERSPTLKGQGKRELFPFAYGLINYMKDRRRAEKVIMRCGEFQLKLQKGLLLMCVLYYIDTVDRIHQEQPCRLAR
jgi:transposase-like protein